MTNMNCFFPWSHLCNLHVQLLLTTLKKVSVLLLDRPHLRLHSMCNVLCSILLTSASDRRSTNLKICFAIAFPMRSDLRDIIQNMLMKLAVLKMLYTCINLLVCCCIRSDTQHDINRSYLVSACGNHTLPFSLRLSLVVNGMLYSLFWAITRSPNIMCWRFGTVSVPSS